MSFDKILLSVESRDLSQADKRMIRILNIFDFAVKGGHQILAKHLDHKKVSAKKYKKFGPQTYLLLSTK